MTAFYHKFCLQDTRHAFIVAFAKVVRVRARSPGQVIVSCFLDQNTSLPQCLSLYLYPELKIAPEKSGLLPAMEEYQSPHPGAVVTRNTP